MSVCGEHPLGPDPLMQLADSHDAIFNDGISDSSEEGGSEGESQGSDDEGELRSPVRRDLEQEERDEAEELALRLAQVGPFKVPQGYTVVPAPTPENLATESSRWKLLEKKKIAYKYVDGWKIGTVYIKGQQKYAGLLWVSYGVQKVGHAFDIAEDYGINGLWVILKPTAARGKK